MVLTGLPLNIDFQQILLHLANFAILFVGLYILLYKPVKDFMAKREAHYKEMDDEATEKLNLAKKQADETASRLAAVDEEINDKKKTAAGEITEMRVQAEKEAQAKADRVVTEAREYAEKEKVRIINSAEKDISDMITTATEKIFVSENVNEAYDAFLKKAGQKRSVTNAE